MKRSFYLGALVLCLFGNVACADYLSELLSKNETYKAAIGTESVKVLNIFRTTGGHNDHYFCGEINNKQAIFDSTDWAKGSTKDRDDALVEIDSLKNQKHEAKVLIKSYTAHRRALLRAFRYNLPNLNTLVENYVEKFFSLPL
ncbi:MAG: hypothetical protein LBJ79_02005 [Endomicrobium sp.]|jgi:hypothetical protein|nr:hypothetical protein [Endomicrobium sp.]